MDSMNLSDAKAHFSEVVERVAAGEEVVITKHGKPRVKVVPIIAPRKKIDFDALKRATAGMTFQTESSVDLIRRMRDESY